MSLALPISDSKPPLLADDFPSDAAWVKYSDALGLTQKLLAAEHAKAVADGSHAAERDSLNRFLQSN